MTWRSFTAKLDRWTAGVLFVLAPLFVAGCARDAANPLAYAHFVESLGDQDRMARIDLPASQLLSSYDRTGGNNDFNYSERTEGDWVIVADLKGPGMVSRVWTTGGLDNNQRFRFFFDGEPVPRIDKTVKEFLESKFPFAPPLSDYSQSAWSSYVPLTYSRRLVIATTKEGVTDGHKLFFQVNAAPLRQAVESFPRQLSEANLAALKTFARQWVSPGKDQAPPPVPPTHSQASIPPHVETDIAILKGPAMLRFLSVDVRFEDTVDPLSREAALQNLILRIRWEDQTRPSVDVPLAAFCGSLWNRIRFDSAFFGATNNAFYCRFPMPFQQRARISLANNSAVAAIARTEVTTEPCKAWNNAFGYFHSTWQRSSLQETGQPHTILRTQGTGKYVGCILGVMSLDKSWWLLEGDEIMWTDGGKEPFWHGTGVEDYFNGGWYYKNNLVCPRFGLVFKSPFRTVQYRIHQDDTVGFKKAFGMIFERGPDNNASHAVMESVAFYYMAKPTSASSGIGNRTLERPTDPLEPYAVMSDLANFERLGDYRGARDDIGTFMGRYPGNPFTPILKLRQIAYDERMFGFETTKPLYTQFLLTETNQLAQEYCKLLLWFHEKPDRALAGVTSCNSVNVFIDNKSACELDNPQVFKVVPLELSAGRHVLSVLAQPKPYPAWTLLSLRTHNGLISSSKTWRSAESPAGEWQSPDFDDSKWAQVDNNMLEGPPMPPHLWMEPHPFVDMQSAGVAMASNFDPVPGKKKCLVFRTVFQVN